MKIKLAKKEAWPEKTVLISMKTSTGLKKIRLKVKTQPAKEQPGIISQDISPHSSQPDSSSEFRGYSTPPAAALPAGPIPVILTEDYDMKEFVKGGIKIPETAESPTIESVGMTEETIEMRRINITYPLIPSEPKKGERVFAYAHIYFNPKINEIVYDIVEPQLDEKSSALLREIKEYVQEKIDVNFGEVRGDATSYIKKIFEGALSYFRAGPDVDVDVLMYYVIRDFVGLEKIEPLLKDKQIEDISCDGMNIPIFIYHRDPRLGSMRTNIKFSDKDSLDSFANKLAERCGKLISVAKPLLDGALPDGSRVQATLSSDVAMHGSNFTIRMFTEKPLTPVDMVKFGTCDLKMLSYFWYLIEHNQSLLISGGTATGKTSLLNALSLFIKPQMKIVSIEDTPELRLPHSHWISEVARTPLSEEGKVDMFELLRESLRQRPDYIIVGEVRGREAYVLFQQMAVGHAGLSTIHAENFNKLMDRLSTPPISLPIGLIQNLDVIIFVKRVKYGRVYKRRISSVIEILGYDRRSNSVVSNEVFRWNPKNDSYTVVNKSSLLKKISETTGASEEEINEDIKRKSNVLKWSAEKNLNDYQKLGSVFNLFYTAPEFLLQRIEYA
ncbi:MAG: type II/IV secretion system ATPase subunit [Candidatus Aenigmarchaeota archaeon]|nr:type II/IV secretion system ATPase subunit [Candidatus Aenigmarchaeota archaeon]